MPLSHSTTIAGNQQRGSAIGTLYEWTPSQWTVCDTSGQVVAQIEVPDALSLSIFIEVQNGDPGVCNYLDFKESDDNASYTSLITGQVGVVGKDRLKNAVPATGARTLVRRISGWKSRYLMVVAYASASNTNIKCYIVGSIFGNQPVSVDEVESALYLRRRFNCAVSTIANQSVSASAPSNGSDGVDVSGYEQAMVVVDPHATNGSTFNIWGYLDDGTTQIWARLDGSNYSGNAAEKWVKKLDCRGFSRLYVRQTGADNIVSVKIAPVG
jgi:hypothetical protein